MLNGKYISTKEIIHNVYRDSGMTHELSYSDAIEWGAECLDLIGCPQSYIKKVTSIDLPIEVCDYKAKLPCDFVNMRQAARLLPDNNIGIHYNNNVILDFTTGEYTSRFNKEASGCRIIPMRYTTDNFHLGLSCNDCIDNNSIVSEFTYELNNDYIFTNFESGFIILSYIGYPVDDCGFPMIPDQIKFKKAVAAYIQERIDYILWRKNDIPRDVYHHSQQEVSWYIGAAQTAGQIPNVDKMESWKNMSVRLIPKINAHADFFKNISSQERLKRK
jgi:hypothetical protein